LVTKANLFDLALEDVSITHVAFSSEFTHAVKAAQSQIGNLSPFCPTGSSKSLICRRKGKARKAIQNPIALWQFK
jgi:prohibitin 2